ncbi:MAG TPA: metallophosphoesterase [Gemmatimonadaceae bacterium]|nr:metallophosphoesterase [Gemmatimonadaceae bacterium]
MSNRIDHDHNDDGVDRRGFLKCMAWTGTGLLWMMQGGVPASRLIRPGEDLAAAAAGADFAFVQISDSHVGFDKAANPHVVATLQEAVHRIGALPRQPAFVIHTGDISHLSAPDEFDTVEQIVRSARSTTGRVFYVPGEHDVLGDGGVSYLKRFAPRGSRNGWYSFDYNGVHFIGLVNVLDLKPGGLGNLGREQLEWLERDVKSLASSTPIVVFAHVPLWSAYPDWGWGTDDGALALSYLKRFGSVTVLNGHIHQVMQKVEGNVTFHTALSTAFPQPAPGTARSPGPIAVPPGTLRDYLGIADVRYVRGAHGLAVVDASLSGAPPVTAHGVLASGAAGARREAVRTAPNEVAIDNFSFTPGTLSVSRGTRITWVNRDDVPHQVVSVDKRFAPSPVIDTGQRFSLALTKPGRYGYFCAIHPRMVGTVVVT